MELTGVTLSAVVLLVRAELMSMVYTPATEAGVLLVGKPVIPQVLQQSVQLAAATHRRLMTLSRENEQLHRKLDEIRLVDRAKCLLIEHARLTEPRRTGRLKSRPWTSGLHARGWRSSFWTVTSCSGLLCMCKGGNTHAISDAAGHHPGRFLCR